jgi:hypothetical protein
MRLSMSCVNSAMNRLSMMVGFPDYSLSSDLILPL